MSNLTAEVERAIASRLRSARLNYYASYALYVFALASSVAATVLVAIEYEKTRWVAVCTALPALALLANNTLRLEERNQWHRTMRRRLEALRRRLLYSGASEKEIAEEWTALNDEMAGEFPQFGTMPGATTKGNAR